MQVDGITRRRRYVERSCTRCNALFSTRADTKQQVCSQSCARRVLSDIDCPRCGVRFHPRNRTIIFCSRQCKNGTDEQRFIAQHTQSEGCWLWTGYRHGRPGFEYGRMRWRGEMTLAHRVSWMVHVGPIPGGMLILHKCPGGGNSLCVNPSHLALGDHQENAADMMRDERHWSSTGTWQPSIGDASPNSKLNASQVAKARRRIADGEVCKDVAESMGLPYRTLNAAVSGASWKHITDPPPVRSTRGGDRRRSKPPGHVA